jgi:hypothetical protein
MMADNRQNEEAVGDDDQGARHTHEQRRTTDHRGVGHDPHHRAERPSGGYLHCCGQRQQQARHGLGMAQVDDEERKGNGDDAETHREQERGGVSPVRRPRMRTVADADGGQREVHLESYDPFASVDLLVDHMVASMLAGLSGRRYHTALEPVGEEVETSASGTSQSSVSRRFIAATAERLAEFRSRPLDDQQ